MSPERDENPLNPWPEYVLGVWKRLDAGQREYGRRSFSREPSDLLDEMQQEVLDLAGWGYVLWHRIERLKEALGEMGGGDRGD